jgi:hypothetical protein
MTDVSQLPVTELDPVRRLHVIAAALPGCVIAEGLIDAPFDAVWGAIDELDTAAPAIESLITSAKVLEREGERMRMRTSFFGVPQTLDVVICPGWCLMRSRFALAGMAARPEGDRTFFAHLESGPPGLRRLLGPLLSWKMDATHELQKFEQIAKARHRA